MNRIRNKIGWFFFAFFAISIGLYPVIYFLIDRTFGLLQWKSAELLADISWNTAFYCHIILGGVTLLIGWTQFSKKIRNRNLKLHRNLGKIYVIAALISGFCGFFIALNATGGVGPVLGFTSSAVFWLYTTSKAYLTIRKGDIKSHQMFMVYSYAVCFSAVTLRFWLPLLSIAFQDFFIAYRVVAWLSWVPNVIFAFYWVRRKNFATL